MNKILFYENDFYEFSNFSPHAIEYEGQLYPTSEHAYQAAKFDDTEIKEAIRQARSPLLAKNLANKTYRERRRGDWDAIKTEIMYKIVKEKLKQHTDVQEALKRTTDKEIIENSPVDYFWGCGKDGSGENQLGKIWMKLREELI